MKLRQPLEATQRVTKEELDLVALQLRNPHSVLVAFQERPEAVIDVRLPPGPPSEAWEEVARLAKQHRVPVVRSAATHDEQRSRRNARETSGGRGGVAEATIKERPDVPLDALFGLDSDGDAASSKPNRRTHRLWLALDQIQDPHNVGAIFRTSAFFGVAGIIITRDRSAPLNSTVYDVASGGIETVPFANPVNLSRALDIAKSAGIWVLGASEHANKNIQDVDRQRSWVLVLGNEERGLRRLTTDKCDELCRIPAQGPIRSLNVSVAAGVMISALSLD